MISQDTNTWKNESEMRVCEVTGHHQCISKWGPKGDNRRQKAGII